MIKVFLVERNDIKTTSCCSTGVHIVTHSVNSETVYVTVFEFFFYQLSGCFKATVRSLMGERPHLPEVYHCIAIVLTHWSPRDS